MSKNKHSFQGDRTHQPQPAVADAGVTRIVAMSLAEEFADAVKAAPEERQELVDAALSVGQWLADRGLSGRWDRVKPAEVLRCLDFLPLSERERFLFSLIGLLGHAAFNGLLAPGAAQRTIDEVATLTKQDVIRTFARTASAHLGAMVASLQAVGC
jgi:hypothetical protein